MVTHRNRRLSKNARPSDTTGFNLDDDDDSGNEASDDHVEEQHQLMGKKSVVDIEGLVAVKTKSKEEHLDKTRLVFIETMAGTMDGFVSSRIFNKSGVKISLFCV